MAVPETLIGIFLDAVTTRPRPDQFMRKAPQGWESISSQRVAADVECLALALRELGVAKGDRVALLSENRYEWPVADLAILGLGAATVTIYPTLTAAQCRYILADSESSLLLVSTREQLEKIRSVAPELPGLREIVCFDSPPEPRYRTHGLADLLHRGAILRDAAPAAFRDSAAQVGAQDLATLIYTSGTTGDPKGAMLTHGNIASNVAACLEVVSFQPQDRCLSFLPLCHVFERMAGLYSMLGAGAGIAYAESIENVAANALDVKPTILIGVPRFFEKVYDRVMAAAQQFPPLRRRIFEWGLERGRRKARAHFEGREIDNLATRLADRLVAAKIRERVGGRLRMCVSGSAPLRPELIEFFFAIGIPVIEGYGLTETSPVICVNPPGRERPGTVGPPVPGVEVRIGDEGEILTRGSHVMHGYYKNPEATATAIRDGWFHTGDVGRLDERGYLTITDRLKDLLVTAGGKKVAPQPIEARLKTNPYIAEAVLLGDRRPYVVALLVPNVAALAAEAKGRGWPEAPAELRKHPAALALFQAEIDRVNRDLAPFETIKRFALLDRELTQEAGELTPTLKVKRRVIMERDAPLIESLYSGEGAAKPR